MVIPIADARAKADGEIVTITGVLTVSDQFAGSAYIQDATGAIAVFDKSVHGTGLFNIGDSITVTGTRSSYSDQVQISPVSAVTNRFDEKQCRTVLRKFRCTRTNAYDGSGSGIGCKRRY